MRENPPSGRDVEERVKNTDARIDAYIAKDGAKGDTAMGSFGRISAIDDLPKERALLRKC